MKNHDPKKAAEYPAETKGSRMAAEVRKKANSLTEQERDELFKRGMQIIYGGSGNQEAIRVRH